MVREAELVTGKCALFATVRDPVVLMSRATMAPLHACLSLLSWFFFSSFTSYFSDRSCNPHSCSVFSTFWCALFLSVTRRVNLSPSAIPLCFPHCAAILATSGSCCSALSSPHLTYVESWLVGPNWKSSVDWVIGVALVHFVFDVAVEGYVLVFRYLCKDCWM